MSLFVKDDIRGQRSGVRIKGKGKRRKAQGTRKESQGSRQTDGGQADIKDQKSEVGIKNPTLNICLFCLIFIRLFTDWAKETSFKATHPDQLK